MIDPGAVQNLVGRWWFNYDEGNFAVWPEMVTDDVAFTCRTDTGQTDYEEFVRADVHGKDSFLAWQEDHRRNSPYPLRHNGTNIHLTGGTANEASFSSYIFVTQITEAGVSNLSSGHCTGAVRDDAGVLRIAALNVVLDTQVSEVFSARASARI
jgi:hypothetical protein